MSRVFGVTAGEHRGESWTEDTPAGQGEENKHHENIGPNITIPQV